MRFTVEYFNPGVLKTIESWPVEVLADYARLVELVTDVGPRVGLPHSRALGQGLFELRPRGRGTTGRVLFGCVQGKRIIVVHAFMKKTRKTPQKHLVLARRRIQEIQREQRHVRTDPS